MLNRLKVVQYTPVSQLTPVYPATQVQVNVLTPSVHAAPFRQGLGRQSSMSEIDKRICTFSNVFNKSEMH